MVFFRKAVRSWMQGVRHLATETLQSTVLTPIAVKPKNRKTWSTLVEQHDLTLNKWLRENVPMKSEEWAAARKELLSCESLNVSEDTVDMLLVNLCAEMQSIDAAMSYLQFCWDSHQEMNVASMAFYLKMCKRIGNDEQDAKRMKYAMGMYDALRSKFPVLDPTTGESCIVGIANTERWKEALEVFDMIEQSCKPRNCSYTAIISAAFNNNEPEIGWKFLKMCYARFRPENDVYTAHLRYCTRNFQGEELEKEIEKMFEFWGDLDTQPFINVITAYIEVLKELGWKASHTSIRDVGICRSCERRLYNIQMSNEDFQKLANAVRDRIIIGDDVYQKTTPRELKIFHQFVERYKPWDIVIDGLNVAYLTKWQQNTQGYLAKSTVRLCAEMGKKVLLLGRKHMIKWPKLDLHYIRHVADVFLADNSSADDPYMLYATLRSGPATMFISKDLMRQHKFLLEDPDIRRSFKHWQMCHQYHPLAVTSPRGTLEVKLKDAPKYLPVVQKDETGWHIPVTYETSLQLSVDSERSKTWFCLRKKPNKSSSSKISEVERKSKHT